ncbi:hypothetical protein [Skermanella stibiiresistens]|uniref:hypothetical protein n=1 Tax=Skermanella stibiiresistens TaxID=913326 RepID=UPI0012F9DBE3|nr:hypothetical protein [Skermanella stibiiresistens]
MLKVITDIVPFMEPYPTWIKGVVAFWMALTAACIILLVFGRLSPIPNQPTAKNMPGSSSAEQKGSSSEMQNSNNSDEVWLIIRGIELYGTHESDAEVQVTATINENKFLYPSRAGVNWLRVGPEMAEQSFSLPRSSRYEVTFSMLMKNVNVYQREIYPKTLERIQESQSEKTSDYINALTNKFLSVKVDYVDISKIPYEGRFILYKLMEGTPDIRGAYPSAEIRYIIKKSPN